MNIANILYGLKLIKILRDGSAPIRVDIALTSACNYHCYFCTSHSLSGGVKPVNMEMGIVMELMQSLYNLGTREILFAGNGEPLLYDGLPGLINTYHSRFKIELLTNGSMLERLDKPTYRRLNRLTVSLNSGNGNSHKLIHSYSGENKFSHIVDNIKRFDRKVRLNYVVTGENQSEVEDFKILAKTLGLSTAIRPVSFDSPDDYGEVYPCYNSYIQPFVTSSGDVLLCPDGQSNPMGNLYNRDFEDIWNDPKNVRLRKQAVEMTKPLFNTCRGCANAQGHSAVFHSIYTKIPRMLK